jgi:hypothetical protein
MAKTRKHNTTKNSLNKKNGRHWAKANQRKLQSERAAAKLIAKLRAKKLVPEITPEDISKAKDDALREREIFEDDIVETKYTEKAVQLLTEVSNGD